MTVTLDTKFTLKEIETLLLQAIQKVKAQSFKEICHYIPSEEGFRIHHFTLKKLQKTHPEKFKALLKEHVIDNDRPQKKDPKPRKQYDKTQKSDLNLEASEIQELLELAKRSNRQDLVEKLRANLPFNKIKKQMLKCIQEERIDMDLWEQYVKAIQFRTSLNSSNEII